MGGGGTKKIKGVLVAVVPVEYLLSYIRSKVHPPAVFDIQEEDGASLLKKKGNSDSSQEKSQENLISGNTLLRIRDSGSSGRELHYRILLSEPSSVRFAEVKKTLYSLLISVFLSMTLILVFAYIIARLVLAPLKKMQGIVNQYAAGNYSSFTEKMFFAEFADFICLLERMGEKILDQLANLQEINSAYARFVPNDFLNYLKKESIIEVQLGDHVEKNMSVLFADIADFTTISERMSPKENFTFVNSILNAVGPVIRNHNGFIDKYIGDAVMALFDISPADAIDAAIGMLDAVTGYNEQRRAQEASAPQIKIRIGINTGHLMLGIIGEYGRMDGTVISDAVNLASRLEGLAKMYEASLLISGYTYYCLKSMKKPFQYTIRELDLVAVKGKSEPVSVFEVLEGEEGEVLQKKRATKKQFEKGVFLYREKDFHKTLQIMREILEYNPKDGAAQLYLDRCEKNIQRGVPDNWQAITRLCVK
ncbi:MAG: adenylate/guanylate cyclase domain-containing protein [Candidatus Electrothrix sp. EH2]|nr:adenylate/guanylate cyclase domain-containing protein [Candidatus Electrothrix sp. EH2]